VAIAVFIAAGLLAWNAFRSFAGPAGSVPDVAEISCVGGDTEVLTPIVRLQTDGLHLRVDGDRDPTAFVIALDDGFRVGFEFAPGTEYPASDLTFTPPGMARVKCGRPGASANDGIRMHIVDPAGLFHDARLSCPVEEPLEHGPFVYFTAGNPAPRAIARAVPGVLSTDEIDYAGFPEGPLGTGGNRRTGSYRIIRGGEVVAGVELSRYDMRSFLQVGSCSGSGIGDSGSHTLDLLASPFQLPGHAPCDPYRAECAAIHVTAARYAEIRGVDPADYAYPEAPWNLCNDDQPDGCPSDPNDVILPVVLEPGDASAFVAAEGCGGTEPTACT
jgi:hypothetical protein